jgi:hypothetical protein
LQAILDLLDGEAILHCILAELENQATKMSVFNIEIFIPKGVRRTIALHDSLDLAEFEALLSVCFIGVEIVALQNSKGVIFPISMVLRKLKDFGGRRFAAILKQQRVTTLEDFNQLESELTPMIVELEEKANTSNTASQARLSHSMKSRSVSSSEGDIRRHEKKALTIAEAKSALGLGDYSSDYIIDYLIGNIVDDVEDDASDENCTWMITQRQFESAMLQLRDRSQQDAATVQPGLPNYLIHRIFDIFDEEKSGYCDLTELGCGFMLFCGGGIAERAQMAYKLVAEWHDNDIIKMNQGVRCEMMVSAIASVLKVVAILNTSYLNSCDPIYTADEITRRAFLRSKIPPTQGSVIGQDDFEYWFSVVLTIYSEIEDEEEENVEVVTQNNTDTDVKFIETGERRPSNLTIDTQSGAYNADDDLQNGDVRVTVPANVVVRQLREAKRLLGLTGVAAEDLMGLLGEVSSEGLLSEDAWKEYLIEFVVGSKADKKRGVELGMKVFRAFDLQHNHAVNYIDFCAGLSFLSDSPVEDKIMVAFVLNDTSGAELISVPELQNIILGSLRVTVACSVFAADKVLKQGVQLEELACLVVLEGLAVMELSSQDSLNLETVSEIALKCIAHSIK